MRISQGSLLLSKRFERATHQSATVGIAADDSLYAIAEALAIVLLSEPVIRPRHALPSNTKQQQQQQQQQQAAAAGSST